MSKKQSKCSGRKRLPSKALRYSGDAKSVIDMDQQDETATIDLRFEDQGELNRRLGWSTLFLPMRRSQKYAVCIAVFFAFLSGIIIPGAAIIFGKIFDAFAAYGSSAISGHELKRRMAKWTLILTQLGIAGWVLNGVFFLSWNVFGELQAKLARDQVFDGLLRRDMGWFDTRAHGIEGLLPRLHTQIRELQTATSQPFGFTVQNLTTAFTALGIALWNSWKLTLVTIAVVPFAALVLSFLSSKIQPSIDRQTDNLSQAAKNAMAAIASIETVKTCNGEAHEIWQYRKNITRAARHYLVQANLSAVQIAFVRFITLAMFVQGFWYGGTLIASSEKSAGQILTTFWACLIATQAVQQMIPHLITLEKGKAAGWEIQSAMSQMENGRVTTPMVGSNNPPSCNGDIYFRKVSFSYPSRSDHLSLNRATFHLPARKLTFVVGRSGSGKSTICNILLGFYASHSGEVSIDGWALQTLSQEWLRRNITLVQQQGALFNGTVLENISVGFNQAVIKERLEAACDFTMLREALRDIPDGLHTVVGPGGYSMSGGQRQRIALARAFMRDSPVLVLDESTSALDSASRVQILENIRQWRKRKTTIIITHDTSMIHSEDHVLVMESGSIVHKGLRADLEKVSSSSFYAPTGTAEDQARKRLLSKIDANENDDLNGTRPLDKDCIGNYSFEDIDTETSSGPSSAAVPTEIRLEQGTKRQSKTWQVRLNQRLSFGRMKSSEIQLISAASQNAQRQREVTLEPSTASTTLKKPLAEDENQMSLKSILRTLWPTLAWKARLILVAGALAATMHAAAIPAFSYVFTQLLTTFFRPLERRRQILKWSLSILGVAAIDSIATYLMYFLLEFCGQQWVDRMRTWAYRRILHQPRSWFDQDKNSRSRLVQCLDRNAEEMRNLVGRFVGLLYVALMMVVMAAIWSLVTSWRLTVLGLGCAPLLYTIGRAFEFLSTKWEGKSNGASETVGAIVEETFTNIRMVRALTLEKHFKQNHLKATSDTLRVGLKRSALLGLFFGLSDSSMLFVTALIGYYGSLLASRRVHTIEQILLVLSLLLFSISNAQVILGFIPQISSSRDTAARLIKLTRLPLKCHESSGRRLVDSVTPIKMQNVNFAYPSRPHAAVLRSLSLEIRSGICTAIVGPSGCGKSTIAAVLTRLYHVTPSSSITVAGIPISSISITTLRSLIGVIHQTPVLFPVTIAENIAYGLPEGATPQSHIEAAARAAGIHEFITGLQEGYETRVGSGGQSLSGGQAQRIAIARALIRGPRVLVMDEATSALDAESAGLIRDCIRRLVRLANVTVVLITHDKDMMRAADRIIMIDRGAVAESGKYEELLNRGGAFAKLLGAGGREG